MSNAAPATPSDSTSTVIDPTTGLQWSSAPISTDELNFADAEAACAACTLDGHSDWRLPTIKELFSIVDHSRFNPAIDPERFPGTPSDWFWSSSPDASAPDCTWIVHFGNGDVFLYHRSSYAFVRAVRSVSPSQ